MDVLAAMVHSAMKSHEITYVIFGLSLKVPFLCLSQSLVHFRFGSHLSVGLSPLLSGMEYFTKELSEGLQRVPLTIVSLFNALSFF